MSDDEQQGGCATAASATAHALYDLAEVRSALNSGHDGDDGDDLESPTDEVGGLAASRDRLRRLLARGEDGRWRRLAHAMPAALPAVEALGRRAPHMRELTDLVLRRLRASLATGTPFLLPPLALVGPPGVGKTWFLDNLARTLALPFRLYPFNLATLSDGLSGSHPGWRASAPGLVARTLLAEDVANPIVLVDELDKCPHAAHVGDAYRPFYAALEPACSSSFVDEHLGFPLDASAISWLASANDVGALPGPVLDRLTVVSVPEMGPAERAAVVLSVYSEANRRFRAFFDPEPPAGVVARLGTTNARRARLVVEEAMVRAAAEGRRTLSPDDVPAPARQRARDVVH